MSLQRKTLQYTIFFFEINKNCLFKFSTEIAIKSVNVFIHRSKTRLFLAHPIQPDNATSTVNRLQTYQIFSD